MTYKVNRKSINMGQGTGPSDCATIRAYLPSNYFTLGFDSENVYFSGTDNAGWTFADYVQPRLASGLYFAERVGDDDALGFTSCIGVVS